MNTINWLIEWYKNNCDEDWEHCYGVRIQTIDNPGWKIDIDLIGTNLEKIDFEKFHRYTTDSDWISCDIKDGVFRGRGSIDKFEEILVIFKSWVEQK